MKFIKRFFIFIIGLLFNAPAVALIVGSWIDSHSNSDDTWAGLFMGVLLMVIGSILWWIVYDMGKGNRKNNADINAVVIPHIENTFDDSGS